MIHIPHDSILNNWVSQFDNTELWHSWRIATGLGIIGAALGRNAWFPYGSAGTIWPNTSVLLVGKSGQGKDTINAPATDVLADVGVQYVAGKTMEAVYLSLHNIGDPAVGYIFAGELKEFIGSKDYQSGILEALTNILSNNSKVDISTKTDLVTSGPKFVKHPTLTMFAGTTVTWMQKIDGILESGFLPRFIVAVELDPKTHFVANPGRYESIAERDRIYEAKAAFADQVRTLRQDWSVRPGPFTEDQEGEYFFTNWYANRHAYFPATLDTYAERSGNLMRKIAMLMAVSRGNRYISRDDYEFSSDFIIHGAIRLEAAVVPTAYDVACAGEILKVLPATYTEILRTFSPKYGPNWVKSGIKYLNETEQITITKEGKLSKNG